MRRLLIFLLLISLLGNSCSLPLISPQLTPQAPTSNTASDMKLQLLGHISGSAVSIAVQGDYAFLGFSYELAVLNIADHAHPQWITSLPLPTNDIVLVGQYAYIAGRDGFAIVDVQDPTHPVQVSAVDFSDTASSIAVTTHDATPNYAYVAVYGDLYTVEVTNPAHPYPIGTTHLAARITGLAAVADKVYAVTSNGFYWLDMANPIQPVVLDWVKSDQLTYGPVIADGDVYFGDQATLWVKDISFAAAPRAAVSGMVFDWIGDVAVVNGIVYLASGFRGLSVWNITDPMKATEIGSYPTTGLTKAVVADANYVYTIDCDEGLRIFAATNPHQLTAIGAFTPLGITYHIAVAGAYAYLASGYNGYLHQIEITVPDQAHTVNRHLTGADVYDLIVADDYLYLIFDIGVGVIDISVPAAPRFISLYPLLNLSTIAVADSYLYVSDYSDNLWLMDRTDTANLVNVAYYPALGYTGGMAIAGKLAYIAHQNVGMRIFEVGNQGELTPIGVYPLTANIKKITVVHGYAYLAIGEHGLAIVDVTEPTTPRLVSRYDTPGDALDMAVQWPYLVLADGEGGLHVLDVTDPAHPNPVTIYATSDCVQQVVSANNLIYAAQSLGGLLILKLSASP